MRPYMNWGACVNFDVRGLPSPTLQKPLDNAKITTRHCEERPDPEHSEGGGISDEAISPLPFPPLAKGRVGWGRNCFPLAEFTLSAANVLGVAITRSLPLQKPRPYRQGSWLTCRDVVE